MKNINRVFVILLCIWFFSLIAMGCSEFDVADTFLDDDFTSSAQINSSNLSEDEVAMFDAADTFSDDDFTSSVQINISNLSEDEIAMIVGTYVGEDGSVLIFFEDGTVSYFYKSWSEIESDNPWMYSDSTLTWYSSSMNCDIYAVLENEKTDILSFKTDSLFKWSTESYEKVYDEAKVMSVDECKELIETKIPQSPSDVLAEETPIVEQASSDEDLDSSTEYEDMDEMVTGYGYVYVRDLMKELGYTAEYEHGYTHLDFTGELTYWTDEELNSTGFIVTGIKEMDSQNKTITLYVNTAENIERVEKQKDLQETLEKNFDPSLAVSAMEQYGRSLYPYGFRLSQVTGRLAETPIDENTWFMKYTCTVTNAAGKKATMTCEAKIKGPESNPTVYDFYVY